MGVEDMTLTLNLPPELESRLQDEAERQGLPLAALTLQLLDQHLPSKSPQEGLAKLLQSWIVEGDAQEQKETGDYLVRSLDEGRLSDRSLFPSELKGVTWRAGRSCWMPGLSVWSPIQSFLPKAFAHGNFR